MDGKGMLGSAPLAGKVVVLDFWAYWCGPCKASIPGLNDLASGLKGQDFALVGVTRESLEDSREVAALQNYPSILDETGAVSGAFSVYALPTLVLIDRGGIVRSVHVGMGDLEALGQHVHQLLAEPAP